MVDTTKVITATEFKTNLGKYIDFVSEDNEVVVTKNGQKVVRLTPYVTEIERYLTLKERATDYQYGGKKVSYEEFMEIYKKSELRMEYINGEIVLLASPDAVHQSISGNLYVLLREYFRGKKCKVLYSPFDVHFFKKDFSAPDVMQPDLIVACDFEEKLNEKNRYMGTPALCVEILSSSTRTKDMVDKLNTFMLSGVREFWIVDPETHTAFVYSFNRHQLDAHAVYRNDETLASHYFQGLELTVADIFAS